MELPESFYRPKWPIPLKPPGGGAPPPTHSWRICDRGLVLAGVLGVLGFLGILAQNLEKIVPEPSQIEARSLKNRVQRLQNRARSPPRRYFLKTSILRALQGSCIFMSGEHFEPTWLHLGGPRGSQIEAKTRKNRGSKTRRFSRGFFNPPVLVLEGFWGGFLKPKRIQNVKTQFLRNP